MVAKSLAVSNTLQLVGSQTLGKKNKNVEKGNGWVRFKCFSWSVKMTLACQLRGHVLSSRDDDETKQAKH